MHTHTLTLTKTVETRFAVGDLVAVRGTRYAYRIDDVRLLAHGVAVYELTPVAAPGYEPGATTRGYEVGKFDAVAELIPAPPEVTYRIAVEQYGDLGPRAGYLRERLEEILSAFKNAPIRFDVVVECELADGAKPYYPRQTFTVGAAK